MTRTQIQLPDEVFARAKAVAAQRDISFAELARRGVEMYLACFPEAAEAPPQPWKMPVVYGEVKVPLECLHDISADEESTRSLPHD